MMSEKDKNIPDGHSDSDMNLRSEVVQEILSDPPSWMLSWGTTIIFATIVLLLCFAGIIKYPDVVIGQAKVTTTNPPVQQVSYSSGKLILLNKKDNEKVNKDETIAIIENLLTENTSNSIQSYLNSVKLNLRTPNTPLPLLDSLSVLGEMETDFNKLTSLVKTYNRTITDSFFQKNIINLRAQIQQYRQLASLSDSQINLSKQDLDNTLDKYKANKKLYENGAITKFDFMAEESKYIMTQKQLSDLEKIKIQNLIALTDYEKQVSDIQFQHDDKLFQIIYSINESINTLKTQLQQWEQKYVIKAPFKGTVSYLNAWAINKYVKQGDNLFTVVPDEQQYIALILVPAINFGKIKTGQLVNLRMDNYAYNEMGVLAGKIKSMTLAPGTDNNYRVEVELTNGLLSTYKKQFDYKPDMMGTAQIITEDLSLLERIFYQFKKLAAYP